MSDRTVVIAANYTQFCQWISKTDRRQEDYQWVGSSVSLHGIDQHAKVFWLTPWLAGGTEAALDKYDQLLEAVRCYELDVTYYRT